MQPEHPVVSLSRATLESVVSVFLGGKSANTIEAYRNDLREFAGFIGADSPDRAALILFSGTQGEANSVAIRYRSDMLDRNLSPSTINRRLAALRSVAKLARTMGAVSWGLDVPSVKSQKYRDTRGPGCLGVAKLLMMSKSRTDAKGTRDTAILRLLYDLGLRRGEVVGLDLSDVDIQNGTLAIVGKGRTERETLTLPEPTKAVLNEWLVARGNSDGPLFVNFDRAAKGQRLTGRSIDRIVKRIGGTAGLTVRPHGIRHAAITEALDSTGGNVRAVQRFSRHRDLRTLTVYDDNRLDLGGDVAKQVANSI